MRIPYDKFLSESAVLEQLIYCNTYGGARVKRCAFWWTISAVPGNSRLPRDAVRVRDGAAACRAGVAARGRIPRCASP